MRGKRLLFPPSNGRIYCRYRHHQVQKKEELTKGPVHKHYGIPIAIHFIIYIKNNYVRTLYSAYRNGPHNPPRYAHCIPIRVVFRDTDSGLVSKESLSWESSILKLLCIRSTHLD